MCALIVEEKVIAFPKIRRDEDYLSKNPPEFVLQLEGEQVTIDALCTLKTARRVKLIQIDTPVFAYEPVLKRLQQIKLVPLWRELLAGGPDAILTRFTNSATTTRIVNALETSPLQDLQRLVSANKSIILDHAQATALHSGLTQAVSLIQGPPGSFYIYLTLFATLLT